VFDIMVNLKEKKLDTLNMTLIRLCSSLNGLPLAYIPYAFKNIRKKQLAVKQFVEQHPVETSTLESLEEFFPSGQTHKINQELLRTSFGIFDLDKWPMGSQWYPGENHYLPCQLQVSAIIFTVSNYSTLMTMIADIQERKPRTSNAKATKEKTTSCG